jgi:tetratricopeptide (TPR) repeat protein
MDVEILTMPTSPKATITKALAAAHRGDSDAVMRLASTLSAGEPPGASDDELWVRAEGAYQRGEYTDALRLFGAFERHSAARRAPAWQIYTSYHHRAFMLHQQARFAEGGQALEELQRLIQKSPKLASRGADVEALFAHRYELEGDFERARARMVEAHRRAIETEQWRRAATTASDVGRLSAVLEWQRRARELALPLNAPRLVRTIDERRAGVLKTLGKLNEAAAIYEAVIAGCLEEPMPGTLHAAYMGRADLRFARGDLRGAEEDFRAALAIAEQMSMKRMMVYPLKDLARLHLERGHEGDLEKAREFFGRAMALIVSLDPPQAILYRQLAEDLLREPRYLSKRMLYSTREKLEKALHRVVELTGPHPYQQAFRLKDFQRAVADLVLQLRNLQEPEIQLASHLVRPQSGTVCDLSTGEAISKIRRSEVELLRYLLDRQADGQHEARSYDVKHDLKGLRSLEAARKRIGRLRGAIGEDLIEVRRGNQRYYRVRTPLPRLR